MPKPTFQSIILNLQSFWAVHGCLITQPYYTQVGAGTMNPATFLRVLGPEPWNVAYVEPSVRPDDGRYGENPNRFQKHTQFQVILKPDTGNPQELYLDSLKALGIDPRQHDIRFVEDNWEQPAISAWGLGWEVWLDGQEITQFTYFQQMGGVTLNPVSVEITYGLERILIALNNAKAIWDEEWGAGVTYGEIIRREEFEHSKYYYEVADIERARQMYDLFSAEADACLAQGLLLPAHDYVLKSSHTFNILDARGAISVAERQAFFRRMRELARKVADGYEEHRKELEYPLLKETKEERRKTLFPLSSFLTHPSSFILEIGTEELPASDVDSAQAYLVSRIPTLLDELHLTHGDIRIYATPRRLVIAADSVSPTQPDREEVVKGPPADKAIVQQTSSLSAGQTGSLTYTPAAQGFAKKNNINVEDLQVREQDGGKYVFAVVKQKGRPTPEVLQEALPKLIAEFKFEKSMRWNNSGVSFSRPIRWFVALLGDMVIPFEYAGVVSGNVSRGLRPYDSPEVKIPSADKYFDVIRDAGIILDKEERKASIVEQVKQAASLVGGEAIIEDGLLSEVANLVEMPTAVMGGFNKEFLSLPRDVLISVMKKHQRYFPIQSKVEGQKSDDPSTFDLRPSTLLPHFIAIRNGDDIGVDIVRQGNEHVLSARFTDANFFVREDLKLKLEEYRPKLASLTFHTKLGSMLDKSSRILKLGAEVGALLGYQGDLNTIKHLGRAAYLCKADLATQMVTEMTSLQGIIGGEYALRSGESPEVAQAIAEQYQTVPRSKIGLAVALTDRLDSLVGLFAAGLAPTGAKDPFGLRRAAIGIVQPLIEHDVDFDLALAVKRSAITQPIEVDEETQGNILEFIAGRLKVVLNEAGYKHDIVEAVLVEQSANPAASAEAVKQLQAWVGREDWSTILPAFARCVRITRDQQKTFKVNEKAFVEKEEKDLFAAIQKTVNRQPSTVDELFEIVVKLTPSINAFFDKVLVMSEDKKLQENRLGLLQQIAALSKGIADMSKLEGF
ncbi:MAG TPA: glycine--tRNA ligase subunit beta [Anaerolineales bacterium]|nr:glycine--tRNA ligase subunit beta [Anaerolineales bacterium]HNQ94249.1 glycine--tRNA ligase subunit beta [Anaerolineales bacterium]HNS60611.1 glycine--tRNA ligase subunit beta [Anaerolineales bacterium]